MTAKKTRTPIPNPDPLLRSTTRVMLLLTLPLLSQYTPPKHHILHILESPLTGSSIEIKDPCVLCAIEQRYMSQLTM